MLRAGMHALVEAIIAGAVVGIGEAIYVVGAADVGSRAVVAAPAALGAIVIAIVARILLAGLARIPTLRRWGDDVVAGRARAIARGVLVLIGVLAFGAIAYTIGARVHAAYRFIDAGPVGLLLAATLAAAAVAVVSAVFAIDRITAFERELDRSTRVFVAIVSCAAIALLPALVVHVTVPALALPPVVIVASVVAAVVVARLVRLPRHFVVVAGAVLVAAVAGTYMLARSADSRGAIVSHGTLSNVVARKVWSLADHDHDRYASASVGGADCDDANPKRNPSAQDIAGNGIDENCTGADAPGSTRPGAKGTGAPASIILISIDSLRADHLGAYGYGRRTSPAMDALAATGTRFEWAYTSCPSTRCAIPSLLTGRYYSTLKQKRDVATLAKSLRDAGWQTAAITCCSRFGLGKNEVAGFTVVDATAEAMRMSRAGQSNADVVIDSALEWLRGRDPAKPYFLWVHLFEPHFPYSAPSGPDFGDDDIDRYDTEIAYADAQLARLIAETNDAIIAVTADHGDEFNEHGIRFHARSLYNQVVRVPLIVRVPGGKPSVVETPVSIVDVMPTLLDLVGVTGPAGLNGVSLAPAVRGEAFTRAPLLIELIPDSSGIKRNMAGVVSAPWKVIWDREANAWSLFHLGDRDDHDNRASDPVLPSLQKLLLETLDRETSPALLQ